MSLTPRAPPGYGLRPPVRTLSPVLLALALAGCNQRGDELPSPPMTQFHYPAFMAAIGQGASPPVLLVESSDLDGAYSDGTLLAAPPADPTHLLGGVVIPANSAEIRALQDAPEVLRGYDEPSLSDCWPEGERPANPFVFVASGVERDAVLRYDVVGGVPTCLEGSCSHVISASWASTVGSLAVACPTRGTRQLWVGFLSGNNDAGYLGQLKLNASGDFLENLVEVYVGQGSPQALAFDRDSNRVYFVTRESAEQSFLRWVDPGTTGCKSFPDQQGVQDETRGGCHVDPGVELSGWLRGAEGADVRLSNTTQPCRTEPGLACRRAYLAIRVYDADIAAAAGGRPSDDIGGELWVMEIPQTFGRPEPRLLHRYPVGIGVMRLQVMKRAGRGDLVAIVARADGQLWIYDDDVEAVVAGVGRDNRGVPLLGHELVGLAAVQRPDDPARVRVYVSSDWDHWVSAVDVSWASGPTTACVVQTGGAPCVPGPVTDPLRIKGSLP